MGGVCKIQPEIDGWVDCYDLDPEGEVHSAGISFSIHAVLGLWVREIGYKGHSQGPFQSEGRRVETGRQLHHKQNVQCPVASPESGGKGLRSKGPFQPLSTKLVT